MLTLLTGGARSGKSSAAVRLAANAGGPVVFVATAEAGDEEMRERISRHRSARPADWRTIEAPRDIGSALDATVDDAIVIIDCLALWLTNVLDLSDREVLELAEALGADLAARLAPTIVVTNEVGSGIVPDNALARRFRDLLGSVNQIVNDVADQAFLCVAGSALPLTRLDDVALGPNSRPVA